MKERVAETRVNDENQNTQGGEKGRRKIVIKIMKAPKYMMENIILFFFAFINYFLNEYIDVS